MLRFVPTQADLNRLKAQAASQKSGVSRKALEALKSARTRQLMRELGR